MINMAETLNGTNGVPAVEGNSLPAIAPTTVAEPTSAPAAETPEIVAEPPKELSAAEKLAQKHAQGASETAETADGESTGKIPEKKQASMEKKGLDVTSAEAFPSLGGPSKAAAAAPKWGANMAAPTNGGTTNGTEIPARVPTPVAAPGASGQEIVELFAHQKRPRPELRKAPAEIAKDIMKKTNTKIDMAQTMATKTTSFVVTGTPENRKKARREIFREFSIAEARTIRIPAATRPHVIGKGGTKIQEIERHTGTKVRVPQMYQVEIAEGDFDEEATIDVTIEGDVEGINHAINTIKEIVCSRPLLVTARLTDIPGELYPFIQGANHQNIIKFESMADHVKVTVPDYHFSEKSSPFSEPFGPITISGEKTIVQGIRAEIQALVEALRASNLLSASVPVARSKHQFFTNHQGALIHEVLAETGCTVILPTGGKVDQAMVYGPSSNIGQGFQAILQKAEKFTCVNLDICRAHPKAPNGPKAHARDITKYLIKRKELLQIQSDFSVQLSYPTEEALYDLKQPCNVGIMGESIDNVKDAQTAVQKLFGEYNPNRLAYVDVEPLHHRHVRGKDGKDAKKLASTHHVELVFPEDREESQILMVYEGGSTDVEEIKEALEKAKIQVLNLTEGHGEITEKVLEVPKDQHAKIQGSNGTTLNALNPSSVLVQFGVTKARRGHAAASEDSITLRGAPSSIDATIKNIKNFLDANKDGDPETVTVTFEYPQQYTGILIGAKGANINKLRDDLGVDINLNDGKGEIKGIQVAADAAKKRLLSQVKELDDKAVFHLKVPQQYHSTIIGSGGVTVKKLEERYGVRILFPRSEKSSRDDDPDTPSNKQAPDEVIVKGGKKGAEGARSEIMDVVKYEIENNHTATIILPSRAVAFMFKNASKDIKQLRDESRARIDIPQEDRDADPESKVEIKIRGTKEAVSHAQAVLSKIVKEAEGTISRKITVDKKYHRSLIGPGGSTLKDIVLKAGGPDDRGLQSRLVRFPNHDIDSDEITVQGPKALVNKIVASIEAIIKDKENQIQTVVEIAPDKHRKLIGREGSVRRELEAQFGVVIEIPRQRPGSGTPTSSGIKITGAPEAVEAVTEHILELVKEPEGETIQVPRRLHHAVADGGLFIRTLQNKYKVSVDHNGQTRPAKQQDNRPKATTPTGDLPLITDEQDDTATENFVWEIEETIQDQEEGDFPWVLRGSLENIAQAKTEIEQAILAAEKQSCIGYLTLPDPRKYRFVVGPGGSTVDKIRRDTGCRIMVPRNQAVGEAITMHGSKEGLEQAKDIILGLVSNNNGGNSNGPNGERKTRGGGYGGGGGGGGRRDRE